MSKIVVITGASAGVGRATADEFTRQGYDVALLARDPARLARAAAELRSAHGVRTLAIPTDVADADAVEAAATKAEDKLRSIDAWVNVAMATVFAPVSKLRFLPYGLPRSWAHPFTASTGCVFRWPMAALRRSPLTGWRSIRTGPHRRYYGPPRCTLPSLNFVTERL